MMNEGLWPEAYPATMELGRTYLFKMEVESGAGGHGTYRMKAWPQGDQEPASWGLERAAPQDLLAGAVILAAHHVDATFGDVEVRPLG